MSYFQDDNLTTHIPIEAPARMRMTRKQMVMSGLAAGLTIALNIVVLLLPIPYHEFGDYGYAGIFVVSILASAIKGLPVPMPAILLIACAFLNPLLVGSVSAVGSTIGETSSYGIGWSSRVILARNALYTRVAGWVLRHGLLALFLFAAIPNPFFTVAGIAFAASRLSPWKYYLAVGTGRIVRGLLFGLLVIYTPNLLHQFIK